MMAWLTDEVGAAAAGGTVNMDTYAGDGFTSDFDDIATVLVPSYVNDLPVRDGWKHAFSYALNTGNPLALHVMAVYSGGRDSELTSSTDFSGITISPTSSGSYDPTSYDNDILWADGAFVVWPEKTTSVVSP
jgi:hypothetical protein